MAKKVRVASKNISTDSAQTTAKSATIFGRGISTDRDYLNACVAVADDLANGRFSAGVGNAIGMNTRNMLKMLELKFKYGALTDSGQRTLQIGG